MNRRDYKLSKKIINQVQYTSDEAIKKNTLIEPNDKILVGISGGIDSLVLLETLATKQKYYNFEFQLTAIHINVENIEYSVDKNQLLDFCNKLNVPLIFKNTLIYIDETKITTNPCFICSWNRRKELFKYAKENNFNKLALGHHLNDAVDTFLMNLVYHSTICSLPTNLKMFSGRMHLIRPLIYLEKAKIEKYAEYRGISPIDKKCQFADASKRSKINVLLEEMKRLNPQAEQNIFNALSKIASEYLPT